MSVDFASVFMERFATISIAPFSDPGFFWVGVPLIVTMLLMVFYFSKHRKDVSWNSATGNSLVLVFVGIDLLRQIFIQSGVVTLAAYVNSFPYTLAGFIVLLYGLVLLLVNFFHLVPKRSTFIASSTLPINLFALVSMCCVYSKAPADVYTIAAALVFFLMLYAVFYVVQLLLYATEKKQRKIEPKEREEPSAPTPSEHLDQAMQESEGQQHQEVMA